MMIDLASFMYTYVTFPCPSQQTEASGLTASKWRTVDAFLELLYEHFVYIALMFPRKNLPRFSLSV